MEHAVGSRLQIIEQFQPGHADGLRQRLFVELPSQIGETRFPIDDRPGHAEAARSQRQPWIFPQKGNQNVLEGGIVVALEGSGTELAQGAA